MLSINIILRQWFQVPFEGGPYHLVLLLPHQSHPEVSSMNVRSTRGADIEHRQNSDEAKVMEMKEICRFWCRSQKQKMTRGSHENESFGLDGWVDVETCLVFCLPSSSSFHFITLYT
ncbi:hypothetical protein V6N13_079381 [Hibiscus sabdariffa]|uniref:Uncharacterized protein n=1 Tax=Hibiscus sabdariffa TaxID=183260 RepID=A0ABR2RR52_9ROSI